jgi:hypothetical protein
MRPGLWLGCRRFSPRVCNWWAGTLGGFILALFIAGDLPVVHDHDAPGVYDQDCPLARLGTVGPRASLASGPDLSPPARAPEAGPVVLRALLSVVSPASFDPRAPPLTSSPSSRAVIG